jgi:hypothetical protein
LRLAPTCRLESRFGTVWLSLDGRLFSESLATVKD